MSAEQVLCINCTLKDRPAVLGQVGKKSDIVIIGEAPGRDEAAQGKPFVGRAGQLLNRVLEELGINREDVNISNSCLCHPIDDKGYNRRPSADEVKCCNERLLMSIDSIEPKIIITLGAVAFYSLVDTGEDLNDVKMGRVAGQIWESKNNYVVMATYHPAYALRNPEYEAVIKEHIKKGLEYGLKKSS